MADMQHKSIDSGGIYWPEDPPVLRDMTAEHFKEVFEGFAYLLVEKTSDQVVAAGMDQGSITVAALERGLDMNNYRFDRGPAEPVGLDLLLLGLDKL